MEISNDKSVEDLSVNNNHGTLTAGTGNLPSWEER